MHFHVLLKIFHTVFTRLENVGASGNGLHDDDVSLQDASDWKQAEDCAHEEILHSLARIDGRYGIEF